ncbi:hypothetical protein EES45_34405 [Streptomyces sp. ADI97-07]|uniref:hypothetical protein n=1 Tax=Streptomyces sp. ADI97-07 TaxID=1522762 RepID=UPI000F550000|nr:hypothetical protein [Streptomyces sp. ADI97-07]RPK71495.1 hypothetical protein EES45_34405 [Streptomyces sp. ADI97-07]
MRTTATAAIAAVTFLATLTACGGSTTEDKPAPAASSALTISSAEAEAIRLCTEAVTKAVGERPADFDVETDTDPMQPECEAISEEH